jgi:hypothetical protein
LGQNTIAPRVAGGVSEDHEFHRNALAVAHDIAAAAPHVKIRTILSASVSTPSIIAVFSRYELLMNGPN